MNQHQQPDLDASNPDTATHDRSDRSDRSEASSGRSGTERHADDADDGRAVSLFAAALGGDLHAAAQLRALASDPTAPDTDHAADALGALALSDALAVERLLETEPDLHAAARTADADQTAAAVHAELNRPPHGPGPAQRDTDALEGPGSAFPPKSSPDSSPDPASP